MPDAVEKCRVKRILKTVDFDMELNKPSGLNLSDFKKILTDTKDKNSIIIDNAETFFNMEKKYNINGVFLATIAIHESNWGTSKIASDKNNLFGYGSYDRDPYEYSVTFETYEEGIETVAKNLVNNYLNEAGTEIYDNNIATGKYYNGATVSGVNKKYASDQEWATKVFKIMENLYGKLQD
jgi:beta-N-acetylglucosaminidase